MSAQPYLKESEEWRVIPGFPDYEVSNMGRLKTKRFREDGRLLCPGRAPRKGRSARYASTCIVDENGSTRKVCIHQIVMWAFVGAQPEGMQVAHNNGNSRDNRLENLRYATPKENAADMILHGTGRRKVTGKVDFATDLVAGQILKQGNCVVPINVLAKWAGVSRGGLYLLAKARSKSELHAPDTEQLQLAILDDLYAKRNGGTAETDTPDNTPDENISGASDDAENTSSLTKKTG